jgi:hypothetical protein
MTRPLDLDTIAGRMPALTDGGRRNSIKLRARADEIGGRLKCPGRRRRQ